MEQNMDLQQFIGAIERTYSEWESLLNGTTDRDKLFDLARDIGLSPIMRDSDREALHKVAAKRIGCTVKALRLDLGRALDGDPDKVGEKDDRQLARETLSLDAGLVYSGGAFFKWREHGVWSPAQEPEIRRTVGDTLARNGLPVLNRKVRDVFAVLRDEAFNDSAVFDEQHAGRVNVANGTLELVGDQWTLREHRREDYLTAQLPVAFDPDAECPRFLQFLDEVFEGDADAADKRALILEMMGYTLLQSCAYEKFIILLGKGANGKSVLLKVLQSLLGKSQYSAVDPSRLNDDTVRSMLHGKLANIVPELPAGSMLADDAMKTFTSSESTTGKLLYADKFTFVPYAKLWMGTNNLPHSRDLSRGMFRRALIVEFNQSFEGREDFALLDKLKAELPGILAAACRAFAGVVARGGFTVPASSDAAVRKWRTSCDQVAEWAEDRCAMAPGLGPVSHRQLFQSFLGWAQDQNISHKVSGKAFTQRLVALGAEQGRFSISKQQVDGFSGIVLL